MVLNVELPLNSHYKLGDVLRPHGKEDEHPDLLGPHLLPEAQAYGGRQDPLEVGHTFPIQYFLSTFTFDIYLYFSLPNIYKFGKP